MPKILKIILLVLLAVLVGIQFIPTGLNKGNVVSAKDISQVYPMPSRVEGILKNSCYDCHSNNTSYPWYNKIQPVAWYLGNHIAEGKKELNFNEFGSYSRRRQRSKLKAVANQIQDGEMPLKTYTFIHRDAKLTKEEKTMILNWVDETLKNTQ